MCWSIKHPTSICYVFTYNLNFSVQDQQHSRGFIYSRTRNSTKSQNQIIFFFLLKKYRSNSIFTLLCMTYKITNSRTTQTFLPQMVCRNRPKIHVSTCGREWVQMSYDNKTDVVAGPKKVKMGEESNTVLS